MDSATGWRSISTMTSRLRQGPTEFLLRGLEKVAGEWQLIAVTHNMLKFFRYRRSQQQLLMAATG
jgi:hypothetical protein